MSLELEVQGPAHPRDWSEGGITTYLQQHDILYSKITPLSGGISSWVWRLDGFEHARDTPNAIKGKYEGGREPVILKCADGMAKLGPVPLSADRLRKEVRALRSRAVKEACGQEPSVRVPCVLRETSRGFVMTWGGDVDLRAAFKLGYFDDASGIGARLGKWLAHLHLAGIDNKDKFEPHNADIDIFVAPGGLEEQAVRAAMGQRGSSEEDIAQALRLLRKPPRVRTATVWDFRPMNTLVRVTDAGRDQPELTVVDWEFTHYGDPAYDLRVWVVEAMVLEGKFGGCGLLGGFLTAYKEHTGAVFVDEELVCKIGAGVGAFLLLVMPTKIWDLEEDERGPWTAVALEYIRAGVGRDMAWLKQSVLRPLL